MEEIIPFEKDAIKEYIDKCIRFWRSECTKDFYAIYYVDAYQSMRYSLFSEKLPLELK